jgi:hypothetical protein
MLQMSQDPLTLGVKIYFDNKSYPFILFDLMVEICLIFFFFFAKI